MTEVLRYHTVEELEALFTTDLTALWELVPTERQRAYRAAYDREVRAAGAVGSDALEQRVADELLTRYRDTALVPIGARWARTPGRVQAAARQDDALTAPEDERSAKPAPPRKSVIVVVLLAVALFGFMVLRLLGGNSEPDYVPDTPEAPAISMTPTALALEEQDSVIQGGDSDREAAYPVSLQIGDGTNPPRVWVVQRRRVGTSEWNYDPNPDTASYVAGMAVRPVIGLPWSEDNAAAFAAMREGTAFTVTMNTGAVLRYEYQSSREVLRSETDIFRQVEPGLVLLLIGETDADGLPTRTRALVTAAYAPDQELTRGGELADVIALPPAIFTPTPEPTPAPPAVPFAAVEAQIIAVTLDADAGHITVALRLYNGGAESVWVTPDDVWLALGYVENPSGPRVPAETLTPFALLPDQAADMTVMWRWGGEPFGSLGVGAWRFGIGH